MKAYCWLYICWSREQAAILQQTAEYIFALEQDKTRLLQQNTTLKRILSQCDREGANSTNSKRSSPKKAKIDQEPRAQENIKDDENNNVLHSDDYVEEIQKELIELRCQLERERRLRINVEDKKRQLEFDLADAKSKSNEKPQKALATSRQNLDTIVQAIKHLEGDKPDLIETPTKCKAEASTNGSSSGENASRRLIVWTRLKSFIEVSIRTADWRGRGMYADYSCMRDWWNSCMIICLCTDSTDFYIRV